MPLDAREPTPDPSRRDRLEDWLEQLFTDHRDRVIDALHAARAGAAESCRRELEFHHAEAIALLEADHANRIKRLEEQHDRSLSQQESRHREEVAHLEVSWREAQDSRIREVEARQSEVLDRAHQDHLRARRGLESDLEDERRTRTRLELEHVEDLAARERAWQQERRELLEAHGERERRWVEERRDIVADHESRELRWQDERRHLQASLRDGEAASSAMVSLEPPPPDPALLERIRGEAFQKGFEAARQELEVRTGSLEQQLSASYEEGLREGQKRAGGGLGLDEARRQAYQNGYEDGKGVGYARGKRQVEGELSGRMQEASRTAYREGFRDGQSSGGDPERSWARGILHLPAGSAVPPHELRQRYKRLSLVLHPDQNPGLGDEFIKNLNRAREVLEA